MDADAAGFDNPKGTCRRSCFGQRLEIAQPIQQQTRCGTRSWFQDDQSRIMLGRKSQNLTEVVVQRDEDPIFASANVEQGFVSGALKVLAPHCRHVVAGRPQRFDTAAAGCLDGGGIAIPSRSRRA
jgi:hypothetical protein